MFLSYHFQLQLLKLLVKFIDNHRGMEDRREEPQIKGSEKWYVFQSGLASIWYFVYKGLFFSASTSVNVQLFSNVCKRKLTLVGCGHII